MEPELNVIVVDDDVVTRYLIGSALRDDDINTVECESAESLFDTLEQHRVDVIILDMVLPEVDGLIALNFLREKSDVGVIMISSRANAEQRIEGLRGGADDFISKPVDTKELVWKVRSLAARVRNQRGVTETQELQLGNCILTPNENVVVKPGTSESCRLTDAEQRLLVALIQHQKQVCTRKILHQCVSKSELTIANDRSIDTLISRIRTKLKAIGCTAKIESVRGQGYRIRF